MGAWFAESRQRIEARAGTALVVAAACAAVLVLATVAPPKLARASWFAARGSGDAGITDSPAGYVGLVSLRGLAAVVFPWGAAR